MSSSEERESFGAGPAVCCWPWRISVRPGPWHSSQRAPRKLFGGEIDIRVVKGWRRKRSRLIDTLKNSSGTSYLNL